MKRNSTLIIVIFFSQLVLAQNKMEVKIDSVFKKWDNINSPGLCVGIIENGKLIFSKGYGSSNLDYNTPITLKTSFNIASVSKQFTAACIGILISQNKIAIDDDIRKYIPELPDYKSIITIRNLLNHTSGIRSYDVLMDLYGFDTSLEYYDNEYLIKLICKQKKLNCVPGEKFLYSNSNYILLAEVIKRVTKIDINEFALKNIFQSLGMTNTLFVLNNKVVIKNRATGYSQIEANVFERDLENESSVGPTHLNTTLEDMILWNENFYTKKIGGQDLFDFLLKQDTLNDGSLLEYGRGLTISDYKGLTTISHSGQTIGFRSTFLQFPKQNTTIILLSNNGRFNSTAYSYVIADILLGEKIKQDPPKLIQAKIDPAIFEGSYRMINGGLNLLTYVKNDTLILKGPQAESVLIPTSQNTFKRINTDLYTYIFTKTKQGNNIITMKFQGNDFCFEKINKINPTKIQNEEYPGEYYSDELGIKYTLVAEDGKLKCSYPYSISGVLEPSTKDEFTSNNTMLYRFTRDKNNQITGLNLSAEGTVSDIWFSKMSDRK